MTAFPSLINIVSVAMSGLILRTGSEDDLVALILQSADRSWHLQSARFSGCKQTLRDPDQTLLTLLGKLSGDLQEPPGNTWYHLVLRISRYHMYAYIIHEYT